MAGLNLGKVAAPGWLAASPARLEGRDGDGQRKLTTILSADVQGYSRLMEADEEGTLARLKASRDAMASLIAAHGGRVVNTWGDGVLAEFPSVVEAVRGASTCRPSSAIAMPACRTPPACCSASASTWAT